MPHTLVVIPTYNERDNILSIVGRVRASVPDADVLVVDDASPDGTGQLADSLAVGDIQVHVLHRSSKDGLGAAYLEAFTWGLSRGYDQLVQLDADGSHLPEQLPALLEAAKSADVVMGSRWIPGGKVQNWPWHRRLLSRGGSVYSRILLRLKQSDVTGGYRVYSARALERMKLSSVESLGYCFQIDMLLHAVRARLKVTEVPITFVERTLGASKMSGPIVIEAMFRVTIWGFTGKSAGHLTAPATSAPHLGGGPTG
ncbi:polyprenol monophosphomannose synthase [Cryobacterium sp. TMT1-21]|uniref:Polyprenol monophosphomannose synthase n=1 Tax=Cryobacterium shii TaxID=1259235 RepID=A0AAQ2C7K7_9MICO|nr:MULTISPECIES: polyprenol monophosphomannose synthase [Cryobacterium]TFC50178.1 polyprenol monophosphomannose synthase [Cryobacterium shii]TFC83168.1 polyprenol monophosphomannose synthase [Cryobacterium sp. TmT2-59]TFD17983.1 polyprenol monophosphomannose synthase [Cryobacterium sp. TMT4-10]TFD18129.1 polyprenol monophosphomannose synthase [Cryobacterium sp. TMT1-21]TFD25003.1 polyprenol monophosphomannose synthase [Cryobacterium sp. TMT2-23]